jgi:hypothetical protein
MGSRPEFDPSADKAGVRGGTAPLDWGATRYLSREGTTKFFSGVLRFPASARNTNVEYKFVFEKGTALAWEDAIAGNRTLTPFSDTTVYWKTFENKPIVTTPSQNVKVTFRINTATVPDTIVKNSFVQVRGSSPPLTWGDNSQVLATQVSGDYWTASGTFASGAAVEYKFFTNGGGAKDRGWESDVAGGNRRLVVGTRDTTLPLQFVNASTAFTQPNQYYTPWTASPDSVAVMFRVNMEGDEGFGASGLLMGVRGGKAPLEWGRTFVLKREASHSNGGQASYNGANIWSGILKFAKSALSAGEKIEYKFVKTNSADPSAPVVEWEDNIRSAPDVSGNRFFTVASGQGDTTLYWKWWRNVPPSPFTVSDTVVIEFRADLTAAIQNRGFTPGDTVWANYGYGSSARGLAGQAPPITKRLVKQGFTNIYAVKDTVVSGVGKVLSYQYYLQKAGQQYREVYFDFSFTPSSDPLAERRHITVPSKNFTVLDTASSVTDSRRKPLFRNTTKLGRVVTVTFTCDLRPAFYTVKAGKKLTAIQGDPTVGNADSVYIYGVSINGPATGGWSGWGSTLRSETLKKMWDDGTHGDAVAGDRIYSVQFTFGPDSTGGRDRVGQEFKFGISGGDNEGGFGNNHIENIDDTNPTTVIASQFGSIDPLFYNAWDFNKKQPVSVGVEPVEGVPQVYSLEQNYPNPFNPTTAIEYSVPASGLVTLKIYNVLGQEVATLVNQMQTAGKYRVTFEAGKLATGLYMYRLQAGQFTDVKKMMLIK